MRRGGIVLSVLLGLVRALHADEPDELIAGRIASIHPAKSLRITTKLPTGVRLALPDPTNAPTLSGGALLVFDTAGTGGVLSVPLPTALAPLGWRALGDPVAPSGYRYRASGSTNEIGRASCRERV